MATSFRVADAGDSADQEGSRSSEEDVASDDKARGEAAQGGDADDFGSMIFYWYFIRKWCK